MADRTDRLAVLRLGQMAGDTETAGSGVIEVRNPGRTDELVGTVVDGTRQHAEDAIAAAERASPG